MDLINDLFPPEDTARWKFAEQASSQPATFTFRSRVNGNRRHVDLDVDLDAAPHHRFPDFFFDRMTITPASLELNRILFRTRIVDIPTWTLTPDSVPNRVNVILPSTMCFGLIYHPFYGVNQ
jgi:hypothetical protein